jgi:hypothetical protein
MTYYILGSGDKQSAVGNPNNVLGEVRGKVFYYELGFKALQKIVETKPELLEDFTIFNDNRESMTVEQFLDVILNKRLISMI